MEFACGIAAWPVAGVLDLALGEPLVSNRFLACSPVAAFACSLEVPVRAGGKSDFTPYQPPNSDVAATANTPCVLRGTKTVLSQSGIIEVPSGDDLEGEALTVTTGLEGSVASFFAEIFSLALSAPFSPAIGTGPNSTELGVVFVRGGGFKGIASYFGFIASLMTALPAGRRSATSRCGHVDSWRFRRRPLRSVSWSSSAKRSI